MGVFPDSIEQPETDNRDNPPDKVHGTVFLKELDGQTCDQRERGRDECPRQKAFSIT